MQNLTAEELASARSDFEERVFNKYFFSTITFDPTKQFAVCQPCPTQAELTAKDENGDYIERDLNVAWWSWKANCVLRKHRHKQVNPEIVGTVFGGQPNELVSAHVKLVTGEVVELRVRDRENFKLRRLLAFQAARSPALLYTDDGELQDNSVRPFIDFKRDTPDEIYEKLARRVSESKPDDLNGMSQEYFFSRYVASVGKMVEDSELTIEDAMRAITLYHEKLPVKT